MRSDWDDQHKKKADVQKRYPDITVDEWRYLLRCANSRLTDLTDKLPRGTDAEIRQAAALVHKIEARLGL